MNILYITQYYYPEVCAPVNRARANAEHFAEKGHNVTVLTEMPNHPHGVIFKGYKHKLFKREIIKNCNIFRIWVYTSQKKNFISRILFYLSFATFASIYCVCNLRKYELVYITSPPLFVALAGVIIRILSPSKKIIFEVRDLWPDSAIQLDELSNRTMIALSEKLEKFIYKLSHKVVVISEYMRNAIIEKGINSNKIVVVHNGTDFQFDVNILRNQAIDIYSRLREKKIIIYAGNVGIAQNLEVIIQAAEKLNDDEQYHFLIIGNGPRREELMKMRNEKHLTNIDFIDEVSREEIPFYLAQADCGVVPLKKLSLFYGALPSKIFDYMACGLPIIVGIDGEAKNILESSRSGYYFEPENSSDLAVKIKLLLKDNRQRDQFSVNAINYVKKYFTRKELTQKLEQMIIQDL